MNRTRHKKFYKKVQLITIDHNGHIIYSDESLFPEWEIGDILYEMHPFFEIVRSLLYTYSPDDNEFTFACVHLSTELTDEKICDITVTIEISEINIVIFDYTKAYEELNIISQERNEALLKLQQQEFLDKLSKEKEIFKNQFVERTHYEMEIPINSINSFLLQLENTNLNDQQKKLIENIKNENERLLQMFTNIVD